MESPPASDAQRATPAWLAFLLGWMGAQALLAPLPSEDPPRPEAGVSAPARVPETRSDGSFDLSRLSPRELRRIPGIGEARAIAIARARWSRSPGAGPLLLEDVPGIGAATAEAAARWLEGLED